jgi:L-threonylcarbamoyladenylate synthase
VTTALISPEQANTFERCMSVGGIAVFPSDTVYGLACDPADEDAFLRVCALKHRRPEKPSAVLFFQLDLALEAMPGLGTRTQTAIATLLPGPATLLVPNPERRFALASGADPHTLGVRVPALPPALQALESVRWPILQTSANLADRPEACTLDEVPYEITSEVDLVLDGGELPGIASTVIDLRTYEDTGAWSIVREGALAQDRITEALG